MKIEGFSDSDWAGDKEGRIRAKVCRMRKGILTCGGLARHEE